MLASGDPREAYAYLEGLPHHLGAARVLGTHGVMCVGAARFPEELIGLDVLGPTAAARQ